MRGLRRWKGQTRREHADGPAPASRHSERSEEFSPAEKIFRCAKGVTVNAARPLLALGVRLHRRNLMWRGHGVPQITLVAQMGRAGTGAAFSGPLGPNQTWLATPCDFLRRAKPTQNE